MEVITETPFNVLPSFSNLPKYGPILTLLVLSQRRSFTFSSSELLLLSGICSLFNSFPLTDLFPEADPTFRPILRICFTSTLLTKLDTWKSSYIIFLPRLSDFLLILLHLSYCFSPLIRSVTEMSLLVCTYFSY